MSQMSVLICLAAGHLMRAYRGYILFASNTGCPRRAAHSTLAQQAPIPSVHGENGRGLLCSSNPGVSCWAETAADRACGLLCAPSSPPLFRPFG